VTRPTLRILTLIGALALPAAGYPQQRPGTAREILARSLAAHGGEALSRWSTLTIKGTVVMNDGTDYDAAYLLLVQKPGKVRLEQDMTAAGGRLFYEYFLNSGVAWSRRNLIPGPGDLAQMNRLLHRCDGIAYYAQRADRLVLKEDGAAEIREKQGKAGEKSGVSIPSYVVEAAVGEEKTELYIDKKTYYLVQEKYDNRTQIYSDFKKFGSVVLPSRIWEIVSAQRGERVLPITCRSVEYDVPIESWLFEEDMPR
jgi:hypothetical protein